MAKLESRWTEFIVEALIRVLGFSSIGFVALIFLFLLREGLPFFFEVPPGNLLGTRWYPTFDLFGTLPLALGSIMVTVVAILIALPLGVATAVVALLFWLLLSRAAAGIVRGLETCRQQLLDLAAERAAARR